MGRKRQVLAILGAPLLFIGIEEFLGMNLGGDMCWLGNGMPFNGQPCPKNFVADPLRMAFAYLWVNLTAFTRYSPWGFPLYAVMMLGTFACAFACFGKALDAK